MTTLWILVANASTAKIFSVPKACMFNGAVTLDLIEAFDHPESREKRIEAASDKQGNFNNATLNDKTHPKEHAADVFANELAQKLEHGRVGNYCQEVMIVAPPTFHGLLNKHLSQSLAACTMVNVEKDYTNEKPDSLVAHLRDYV